MDPSFNTVYYQLRQRYIYGRPSYIRRKGFKQTSTFLENSSDFNDYSPKNSFYGKIKFHIDKSIYRAGEDRLREDAHNFLLLNFTEMIIKPLGFNDSVPQTDLSELMLDIDSDIKMIVDDAVAETDSNPTSGTMPPVSGGDILQSLAKLYSQLKVAQYRVWN